MNQDLAAPQRMWLTTEQAAEFLNVTAPTISDYVANGYLARVTRRTGRGGLYYLYDRADLIAFDKRFPQGSNGRRGVRTEARVERNVSRRRCVDGRVRYLARFIDETGKQRTRTFATLDGARRWRDRMEAKRSPEAEQAKAPSPQDARTNRVGWWARLLRRSSHRPWEVSA